MAPRLSLAALLLVPAALNATVLPGWDLEEVARRADLVVTGVVETKRSLYIDDRLCTETQIRVTETLKGAATKSIVVTQLGGRDGDRVVEVVGDARLDQGTRVLLFTRGHRSGRRYLVGMALGAFRLEDQELSQVITAPTLHRGVPRRLPGRRVLTLGEVRRLLAGRSR